MTIRITAINNLNRFRIIKLVSKHCLDEENLTEEEIMRRVKDSKLTIEFYKKKLVLEARFKSMTSVMKQTYKARIKLQEEYISDLLSPYGPGYYNVYNVIFVPDKNEYKFSVKATSLMKKVKEHLIWQKIGRAEWGIEFNGNKIKTYTNL